MIDRRASPLAAEVGQIIEQGLDAGWSLRIGVNDGVAHVGAVRGMDDYAVDVEGEDSMENLRLALATLARRIKL